MMIDFEIPMWIKATEKDLAPLSPPLPKSVEDDMLQIDGLLANGPFVVENPESANTRYVAMSLRVDLNPDARTLLWVTDLSHSHGMGVRGEMKMKDDALVFAAGKGEGRFRPLRPEDAEWIFDDGTKRLPVPKIIERMFPEPQAGDE